MATSQIGEVFQVATNKALTETGGGHGQKGVDFQRAWALSRMFEIEDGGAADFLFLFEAIQDVAVLDSPTNPTSIQIYQVKKKDRNEWEWSDLTDLQDPTKNHKKPKDPSAISSSPIGKLYSSVIAFKGLQSSGGFVSNAGANLPLANGGNASTSVSCDLSQLSSKHLDLLEKGLKTLHDSDQGVPSPSLISIQKVSLPPADPSTHLNGLAVAFLNKRSARHAGQAKALVDALLAEIGPLGSKTDSCASFEELRQQRGYARSDFIDALGALEAVPDMQALLDAWLAKLEKEGGIDFMLATSTRVAGGRIFTRNLMGGEDPEVTALIADCDSWIDANPPGSDLSPYFQEARAHLEPLHPSFKSAEFIAHFMLRAIKKCVDLI
ncbi:MAG: dsDNA nuclease domain-containing protein [Hylemonella sp.]